jgi:hypothetical protein
MFPFSKIGIKIVFALTICAQLMVCWPTVAGSCICSETHPKSSETYTCLSGSNSDKHSMPCCQNEPPAKSTKKMCCCKNGKVLNSNGRNSSLSDEPRKEDPTSPWDQCGCPLLPQHHSDKGSLPPPTAEAEQLVKLVLPTAILLHEDPYIPHIPSWVVTNPILLEHQNLVVLLIRFNC